MTQDHPQHQAKALELVVEPGRDGLRIRDHPRDIFPQIFPDLPVHLRIGQRRKRLAAVTVHHLLKDIMDRGAGFKGGILHLLPGTDPQHLIAEKQVRALIKAVDGRRRKVKFLPQKLPGMDSADIAGRGIGRRPVQAQKAVLLPQPLQKGRQQGRLRRILCQRGRIAVLCRAGIDDPEFRRQFRGLLRPDA